MTGTGAPWTCAEPASSAPTTATSGQPITVNWQVTDAEQQGHHRQLAGQRLSLDHADDHVQLHPARQRDAHAAAWPPAPRTTPA